MPLSDYRLRLKLRLNWNQSEKKGNLKFNEFCFD